MSHFAGIVDMSAGLDDDISAIPEAEVLSESGDDTLEDTTPDSDHRVADPNYVNELDFEDELREVWPKTDLKSRGRSNVRKEFT